jgi:amidase
MTWAFLDRAKQLSALDLLEARSKMTAVAQAIGLSMAGIDVILTPALSADPARLGSLTYAAFGWDLDPWVERGYSFAPFAEPANLAGQPSAVLPASLTDSGLPVAVQVIGRPGEDAFVLRVSKALEDTIGWTGLPLRSHGFGRPHNVHH